mgnify:CR=1 FL=1
MYLLDTSVLVELLLDQEKADEVERVFRTVPPSDLCVTEFTLYSLGIILFRRKQQHTFLRIVNDLFVESGLCRVRLNVEDMPSVASASLRFSLDFDDAHQYAAAKKYDLVLVSFDADFDRTEQGRITPGAIGARAGTPRPKAYTVEQIRREYPKAYMKWTDEEDKRLKSEYALGKTITELARILQRKPSAIRSRLRKLGMID